VEKSLKRDFDEILDTIYGATGANPETVETMNAVFNQVQKLAEEIRRNKRRRTNDPTEGHD
jgi:DNA-binding transcriptional regulator YbjK